MRENLKSSAFGRTILTLIHFSLPLILSGILQQLYNWADAFIVGNVEGELALAAVGSTTTLINFYVNAITGFTLGLSILFAQKYGNGEHGSLSRILSSFSVFLGGIFLLLAGVGIGLTAPLLKLLHTTPDTIGLAEEYLRIIFAGIPFLAVYNVYSAALRGIGDSRAPFYSVLLSSLVNVVLDILFVACFRWNVAGAAIATVFSQAAMTLFLIAYSVRKYPLLRFSLRGRLFHREALTDGIHFGFPPMLQSSVSSAGSLTLQNFMNGFGSQTVAAVTTAYRVDSVVMLPIINLGSGISTLTAQQYGAGNQKEARRIFSAGLFVMSVTALLLTALVIPLRRTSDRPLRRRGRGCLHRRAVFPQDRRLLSGLRPFHGCPRLSGRAGRRGLFQLRGHRRPGCADRGFLRLCLPFWQYDHCPGGGFSWAVLLLLYITRLLWRERRIPPSPPDPF